MTDRLSCNLLRFYFTTTILAASHISVRETLRQFTAGLSVSAQVPQNV